MSDTPLRLSTHAEMTPPSPSVTSDGAEHAPAAVHKATPLSPKYRMPVKKKRCA
jgi:hypothetical protein